MSNPHNFDEETHVCFILKKINLRLIKPFFDRQKEFLLRKLTKAQVVLPEEIKMWIYT